MNGTNWFNAAAAPGGGGGANLGASSSSLFGNSSSFNNNNNPQQPGGGLFGNSSTNNNTNLNGSALFGGNNNGGIPNSPSSAAFGGQARNGAANQSQDIPATEYNENQRLQNKYLESFTPGGNKKKGVGAVSPGLDLGLGRGCSCVCSGRVRGVWRRGLSGGAIGVSRFFLQFHRLISKTISFIAGRPCFAGIFVALVPTSCWLPICLLLAGINPTQPNPIEINHTPTLNLNLNPKTEPYIPTEPSSNQIYRPRLHPPPPADRWGRSPSLPGSGVTVFMGLGECFLHFCGMALPVK